MKRVHLVITGFVQGVGFRAWVIRQAQDLGLTGYVKNSFNGEVETIAEGRKETLEEFIRLCRKGPQSARVEQVITNWSQAKGEYEAFEVR